MNAPRRWSRNRINTDPSLARPRACACGVACAPEFLPQTHTCVATIWGPLSRSAAASSRHLYLVKHWLAFTLGSRRPGDAYTCARDKLLTWVFYTLYQLHIKLYVFVIHAPQAVGARPPVVLVLSCLTALYIATPSREHCPSAMRMSQHTSRTQGSPESWAGRWRCACFRLHGWMQ